MILERDAGDARRQLVVTGSSAGGIDALIALVGGLPADFGAPIVIAQHLAPGHASRLADILRAKTSLRIVTVDDRETLESGTIYLVGPDRDVEIVDDSANVFAVARKGPKPSIDRLFVTAAESHGDRLIAIIFSGMGSDGLTGARVVKEHGGTVVVQDPASASFPSMPLAIPPTLVDLSGRAEAIGGMLAALLEAERRPPEAGALQALLLQLRDRSGIDFTRYKMPTIMRRLSRLMVAAHADSVAEYVRYTNAHPEEYGRLVRAFLIKVTEFFRDPALFEELRTTVLPALIEHARSGGSELRIWSAGTSTGEEAYSLAILCTELLRDDPGITVRIFATDLDDEAIAFARRGVYGAESLHNVPAALVERYFERNGANYEVAKRVRSMTVFGRHDLGARAPFPRIDLCVCRNVLIYFTKELQARALHLFTFALRDGGFLVVGKAESPGPLAEYFRVVDATQKIYQRQGDRIVLPPARLHDAPGTTDGSRSEKTHGAMLRRTERPAAGHDGFGAFMAASPIGIVIVDRRYDIVALNAAARAHLEVHGVAVGDDLLHLVRRIDPDELRTLIDAAFAGETPDARELAVADAQREKETWLRVSAVPDRASARVETVALMLVDVSANVGRRLALESTSARQSVELDASAGRIEELSRRVKALLQANDELTRANADLREVNDQLQIHAEEAASANEEIETLNEEMQATNEELETLNEELQATVEELNATNEELGARGERLELAAADKEAAFGILDGARSALAAALEAIGGPMAIVQPDGRVVYASKALGGAPAFAELSPGWWRTASVRLDGSAYEPRVVPLDGAPFVIALMRRLA